MTRKLALGCMTLGACVLLAGCQNSGGSKLANRGGPLQGMMARNKQQPPAPNFPANTNTAGRTGAPVVNAAVPAQPNNPFPLAPQGQGLSPVGAQNAALPAIPQPLRPPAGPSNAQGNVVISQPANLAPLPPLPPPTQPLNPPGITPLPPM